MSDLDKRSESAKKEEEILQFWKENHIFEKSLEKDSPKGEFVFYEGPPTANGRPGIHHLESRAFKDAIPRYKTMQGYHVRRKAGWDTHGLPVELEVEKELGISSKPQIEEFGIAKFNEKCKESVWKYVDEWQRFTERIGYWLDFDDAYVTYKPEYMESLWWVLGQVEKKGLLYQDYKVVPWCPRCGTALSSHELAQGYADVKDLSVTVRFKLVDEPDVSILAWTTTPWTLPGNVGLAVGEDIIYVKVSTGEEVAILAKDCLETYFSGQPYEILEEFKGNDLVGKKYEPLYPYLKELISGDEASKLDNAYQIYPANFVTTEDGTGVVHTAVMYGADDFELGTLVGLPKFHLVNDRGHFIEGTDFLEDRFVKDEEVAIDIIKDLAHRGLLFAKEKYEHSYPHCWRCKTPIIYYARDSWYIRMSDVQKKLAEENQKINWEPEHIKNGRFGEWLENIRDWAISRERYWGTPLPIWVSEDGDRIVVDSIDTLKKYTKKNGNKYFVMRHGEGEHNVQNICSGGIKEGTHHLTDKGKENAKKSGRELQEKHIDLIIASPLVRTRETAEIVAVELGIDPAKIVYDNRLQELNFGEFNLKSIDEYHAYFNGFVERFFKAAPGGESYQDVKKRVADLLWDIDSQYENKTILFVTHDAPSWLLQAAASAKDAREAIKSAYQGNYLQPAEYTRVDFYPLPHNDDFELDLHRPYIDEVVLEKDGKEYRRVLEVMDVWFDSGAMPVAQDHYPFENKDWIDGEGYPADYISEAIDQTRGWFYTLLAVGVLLDRGTPYKNVICLGHILDAEGQKMSKSRGNTVNPWEMIEKYGVDVLRFWMYSVNQPGESKNFDERTVDEVQKKIFNLLRNVVNFYSLYADTAFDGDPYESTHVLDVWILSLLDQLIEDVTTSLDSYRLLDATRSIRDFVSDLSQWYIRRSRDRFKSEDEDDRIYALITTRYVLDTVSRLMAPFTPFFAEELYLQIKELEAEESVHLVEWPAVRNIDTELIKDMNTARNVVSEALKMREVSGIKVRQPLQELSINHAQLSGKSQILQVIADEVNVKSVVVDESQIDPVVLDTKVTPELREEGQVRELTRFIQGLRKAAGLLPEDRIVLHLSDTAIIRALIERWRTEISKTVNAASFEFIESLEGDSIDLEGESVALKIERA